MAVLLVTAPDPASASKQPQPEPASGPAVEAVVDRRGRAVGVGAVAPSRARLEHVDDARNHPSVVHPPRPRLVLGKVRLNRRPLLVRQPKQHAHGRLRRPSERRNHDLPTTIKPVIGFGA